MEIRFVVRRFAPRFVPSALPLVLASLAFLFASSRLIHATLVSVNSDSLYLAGLYRDIFVDGVSIRHWTLQQAPSLFPDLPLFFLLRAITGNAVLATGAYCAAQLLFGAALVAMLAMDLGFERPWRAWLAALLAMSTLAYLTSFGDFLHAFFLPSCHGMCVWVGLGCFLLIERQLKRRRLNLWSLSGVFVLSSLTLASDRLYLLQVVAPLGAALCFAAFIARSNRALLALYAAALGLSVIAAYFVELLPRAIGMKVPPSPPELVLHWQRIRDMVGKLPLPDDRTVQWLNLALLVVSLVVGLAVVAAPILGRGTPRAGLGQRRHFAASAFVLTMVITFFGVGFSGAVWEVWCARYLWPLFPLPYVVVALWLALSRRLSSHIVVPAIAVVLIAWAGAPRFSKTQAAAFADSVVYPTQVACIDRVASQHGARYGYADYWHARKTTEMSKVGIHVLPVTPAFRPNDWIGNMAWFEHVATIHSPFLVLTDRITTGHVRDVLGPPLHVETCPEEQVWIYADPPRARP